MPSLPYSLISCNGFSEATESWVASAPCLKSRMGLVFLFFILAVIRRWGFEMIGISFSFILSAIGGVLSYVIIVSIFGSFKFALVIGLIVGVVCGIFGGIFLGDGGE